jgi:hypothetical protein
MTVVCRVMLEHVDLVRRAHRPPPLAQRDRAIGSMVRVKILST